MGISEARHRANEKYNAKAYDEIKLRVAKGEKERIQAWARQHGSGSVNSYIIEAIAQRMEREQAQQAAQPEDTQQGSCPSTLDTMRAIAASGRSAADIIREERAAAAAKAEADRAETHREDIPISFPDSDDDIDKVDLPF